MSKYTTEVRYICETAAGLKESTGYLSVNQIVEKALPSVFDFPFPIFDETYRALLEKKILKHYYTREIGLETVGLWKLKLDTKLNEIMPYYNQLYKSTLLEFNPLYDVDLTRDHKLTKKETAKQTENANINTNETGSQINDSNTNITNTTGSTSEETASGTKQHYDKYSDTPQGSLINVQNDTYLTNARMINDTDAQTGKTTVTGDDKSDGTTHATTDTNTSTDTTRDNNINRNVDTLDDYLEHVKGKNGGASYSAMLNEYRTTFLNIDMQVINELSDLFFNLW